MRWLRVSLALLGMGILSALGWYFLGPSFGGKPLGFRRLSGTMTVLRYPDRGLNLFFNSDARLIGYELLFDGAPASAKHRASALAGTGLSVSYGASPDDVKRRFGLPSAAAVRERAGPMADGRTRSVSYAYWPVVGSEIDVRKGFRYFHFAGSRLDRAGELFAPFRLANGVTYGASRSAVIEAYGRPASTATTREPPFVKEFLP